MAGVGYELPAWTVLALWLAEQRHLARSGAGSRWAPYLSILPEASGTVLDWRPGEVRARCGVRLAWRARALC